ncbi:MAG: hypothetical protein QFB86_01295 [Patescibacteria group bacterium]|nr:hypothetical protein [Patescibacteria group bacterium]
MADVESFRNHVLEAGVLDPEGTHHEFVSGMHGRKLDFDKIAIGSPLYEEWTTVAADYISEEYSELPQIILGVANGTNRVAIDTARHFNGDVIGAVSEKDPENSKKLYLSEMAGKLITAMQPELVVVLEDVGTTGSNSVQVARHALAAGAQEVEVVLTWQRQSKLQKLLDSGIAYRAIINEPLPTYDPEECENVGYCADGWGFIPRAK